MRICKEVNRLIKYKVSNDLSYKDLSEKMGINLVTINKWCLGRVSPNNESKAKILDFLKNAEQTEQNQMKQTELLDYGKQAKGIFEVRMDIDYLHKRLDKANDIQSLKDLVDELDKIAKMGQLMIARK